MLWHVNDTNQTEWVSTPFDFEVSIKLSCCRLD
jgi:hypothetical protein